MHGDVVPAGNEVSINAGEPLWVERRQPANLVSGAREDDTSGGSTAPDIMGPLGNARLRLTLRPGVRRAGCRPLRGLARPAARKRSALARTQNRALTRPL
jgi:hypothetical protein